MTISLHDLSRNNRFRHGKLSHDQSPTRTKQEQDCDQMNTQEQNKNKVMTTCTLKYNSETEPPSSLCCYSTALFLPPLSQQCHTYLSTSSARQDAMQYHDILHNIISYHVILNHIMKYHIISHHIVICHIV